MSVRARVRRLRSAFPAVAALVLTASILLALACNSTAGPAVTTEPAETDSEIATATSETGPKSTTEPTSPGGNGVSDEDVEETLRRMLLQPDDLVPGFVRVDETFTTNEDLIASSADPDATREEVELWGRILAYEATFHPGPAAPPGTVAQAINSSSSLYDTAEGAALSFTDVRESVEETDWQAAQPDLEQFQQELIERESMADELVWLRLSGLAPALGGIVIDDLIIFRVGRARGFLRVLAVSPDEDRNLILGDVEGWVRAQIQRMKDALGVEV